MRLRSPALIIGIVTGLLALASQGRAQATTPVDIKGTVIDARSSAPLHGARVSLTTTDGRGLFPPRGASRTLAESVVTSSDSAGRYELRGVPRGQYQLVVRRIGYQPGIVDVDLAQVTGASRLSVGLVVVPVHLRALRVEGVSDGAFGQLAMEQDTSTSRIGAAHVRQSRFLSTDVRELTAIGSLEAGGAGDVDIFRAMRRMPGVTGLDDNSADLWIRGARWDQVRVSYDGLPLFNPFHASGTMTGIGGDAIGGAFLHPGVRSVSLFAQGASLVDIRSRSATDSVTYATADVSNYGVSLLGEKARRDGRAGISVAGRRTLPGGFGTRRFSELAARIDVDLGGDKSLELSTLRSRDFPRFWDVNASTGELRSMYSITSGTYLSRLTFSLPVGRLLVTQTLGSSLYDGNGTVAPFAPGARDSTLGLYGGSQWAPGGRYTHIDFLTLKGTVRSRGQATGSALQGGYELASYASRSMAPGATVYWSDLSSRSVHIDRSLRLGSLWAEKRWAASDRLTVEGGLRAEMNPADPTVRLAPTLQARYRLDERTSLSAGLGRTYQDAQELPMVGTTVGEGRGIWLLSGRDMKPIRADQGSVGVARWLGESVTADANVYVRRLDDVATLPLPNGDTLSRVLFSSSQITAHGVELSARKLAGRLTGSLGYTYGRSRERVGAVETFATGDRTHAFDAAAMLRLGGLRLGAGYTVMSGAPYTRIHLGDGIIIKGDSIAWKSLSIAETRNDQRLPVHASLDVFAEWTTRIRGASLTPYLGLRNTGASGDTMALPLASWSGSGPAADQFVRTASIRVHAGMRIVF